MATAQRVIQTRGKPLFSGRPSCVAGRWDPYFDKNLGQVVTRGLRTPIGIVYLAGVSPSQCERAAEADERLRRRVDRTALRLIATSPFASVLVGVLAVEAGRSFDEAMGLAVITLAIVWGFLGALSWLTACGFEATERVVEHRKLLRSAVVDPQHGQLALRISGELSETEPRD